MENKKVRVLLEDIRSQFRVFGEGLSGLNEKLERFIKENRAEHESMREMIAKNTIAVFELNGRVAKIEGRIAKLEGRIAKLEGRIAKIEGRITKLEERVAKIEKNIELIKNDILFIKQELRKKADQDEFNALEKRVLLLERKLSRA